ncbi:MAG: hypothetical protein MJZ77_06850 [Bacteroidales bacterium]|nr:hypothetical protein [Bacteroidales bacterium]
MKPTIDKELETLFEAKRRHDEDLRRQEELCLMIEKAESRGKHHIALWLGTAAACAAIVVTVLTTSPREPRFAQVAPQDTQAPTEKIAPKPLPQEADITAVSMSPTPSKRWTAAASPVPHNAANSVAIPEAVEVPPLLEAPEQLTAAVAEMPICDTFAPLETSAPSVIHLRTENTLVAYSSSKQKTGLIIGNLAIQIGQESEEESALLAFNF